MPIITISQDAFTDGQTLAEQVAAILRYRCVGREALVGASQRYGMPEAKFTEILESEPHWWERWQEGLRLYRIVLQAAMCEIAQSGDLVYHGHAGQELFPGIRHVLKVRLTAPRRYRVEQVRAQQALNDAAALRYIERVDRARTRRLQAIFGADWRDASRYDLVLNIAQMSLETAAHLVVEAAQRKEYQPTADSDQAFQDLTITANVQAALIMSAETRSLNLGVSVRAQYGQVRVFGILARPELEEEVIRVIKGVRGVTHVIADFELFPTDSMYP
jgi:cytidylate kinase